MQFRFSSEHKQAQNPFAVRRFGGCGRAPSCGSSELTKLLYQPVAMAAPLWKSRLATAAAAPPALTVCRSRHRSPRSWQQTQWVLFFKTTIWRLIFKPADQLQLARRPSPGGYLCTSLQQLPQPGTYLTSGRAGSASVLGSLVKASILFC